MAETGPAVVMTVELRRASVSLKKLFLILSGYINSKAAGHLDRYLIMAPMPRTIKIKTRIPISHMKIIPPEFIILFAF